MLFRLLALPQFVLLMTLEGSSMRNSLLTPFEPMFQF